MVVHDPRWRFLAAYAEALHRDGTSAGPLERALLSCAVSLGVPLRVVASPTMILLSIGPCLSPWTVMMPVEVGALDIHRHVQVEFIVRSVCAQKLSASDGVEALRRGFQPLYGRTLRALASVVLCGAAAPLFGGGAGAVVAASAGGMAVAMMSELSVLQALRVPLSAGLGTGVALSSAQWLNADPSSALLGALLMLMPGLSATVAVSELASGHLIAGMARAAGVGATLAQVGLGMIVATGLVGGGGGREVHDIGVPVWAAMVVFALAFTVVLGARVRLAGWIAGIVFIAWAGSSLEHWLGPYAGAGVAAWLVGTAANLWARHKRSPATALAVPGMLLLVPGATGLHGVLSALTGDVVLGLDQLLQMGMTSTALATGFLAARDPLGAGPMDAAYGDRRRDVPHGSTTWVEWCTDE